MGMPKTKPNSERPVVFCQFYLKSKVLVHLTIKHLFSDCCFANNIALLPLSFYFCSLVTRGERWSSRFALCCSADALIWWALHCVFIGDDLYLGCVSQTSLCWRLCGTCWPFPSKIQCPYLQEWPLTWAWQRWRCTQDCLWTGRCWERRHTRIIKTHCGDSFG